MIDFNRPCQIGNEIEYIKQVLAKQKFSGDGEFNKLCCQLMEEKFNCKKVFLTPSCTHALELAALLANISQDDEVIMPSYTFTSTANAFVLRGARIVFIDVNPQTMNMDERLIEAAITNKTRAIVPVHYAGVICEMDTVMELAQKHNFIVIEDAAQAVMSQYKKKYAGTIGHIGCYSFHETKNYNCGEGGAILINQNDLIEKTEIIREKGTNRSKFMRGEIDKYSWVGSGSSYLMSELNAAYLYGQLKNLEEINMQRLFIWKKYYELLSDLQAQNLIKLPFIPDNCLHNAHMFYIKLKDLQERENLRLYLKDKNIYAVFHYIPLHSSLAGMRFGIFNGEDINTTAESDKLLRLPLYYGMTNAEIEQVFQAIHEFFQ